MKNFDLFVGIDWSGAREPITTKSIAVATLDKNGGAPVLHPTIRSRMAVVEWIESLMTHQGRMLIGIDCNFGYASSVVQAQLGKLATAPELWSEIDRLNHDQPNFFAGDFWTHPDYAPYFWTSGKRLEGFEMPQRQTETTCVENGYGRPESPFKLIGAKQVGKGGLAGMRVAHHLKKKFGHDIAIWPFDGHIDNAKIVMTEIYPRQFLMRVGHGTTKVRDAETLNTILPLLKSSVMRDHGDVTDHDTDALVSAAGLRYLCGMKDIVPSAISAPPAMTTMARQCEGWIFGVGDKDR